MSNMFRHTPKPEINGQAHQGNIPHAQQHAMLGGQHLQNNAVATHHQALNAAHCLPTAPQNQV